MEYCPYENAFDILPKKEEKRKKRAKVNMDFLDTPVADDSTYLPVVGNKTDILSLQNFSEAFNDVATNIPVPPVNKFKPLPKYFMGEEDEGFIDPIGTKEVISPQNTLPTFQTSASFDNHTNDRPNINDGWKPVTRSNTYTAFYDDALSSPTPSLSQMKKEREKEIKPLKEESYSSNDLVKKIDILFERLNALEKECKGDVNQNNQKEILMFVGSGFVFLLGLHLMRR
jgi:hypothetical protein